MKLNKLSKNTLAIIIVISAIFICGCGSKEVTEVVSGTSYGEATIIPDGVTLDGVDVSGMNREQAINAVNSYIESLGSIELTLKAEDGSTYKVDAGTLMPTWVNEYVVDTAIDITGGDNVIKRYKAVSDLSGSGNDMALFIALDASAIWGYLSELNIENLDIGSSVAYIQLNFYDYYKAGITEYDLIYYPVEEVILEEAALAETEE